MRSVMEIIYDNIYTLSCSIYLVFIAPETRATM